MTTATQQTSKAKVVKYLSEGMTGKQLMKAKSEGNKAHKADALSFSYCLKRALQFAPSYLGGLKVDVNLLTPSNLLPMLNDKERAKGKFSVWLVLTLIKRYAQLTNR